MDAAKVQKNSHAASIASAIQINQNMVVSSKIARRRNLA